MANVNRDTLYRVGSITKLLTIYVILAESGLEYWYEPISNHIPELARASVESRVRDVRWSEITLGALAAHLGGISRSCKCTNWL